MLSLLVAMLLAAQPAAPASPTLAPPTPAPSAETKSVPLTAEQAVDANGVPAWAKRKPKQPVQACETKPGIGIETWRQNYDSQGKDRRKTPPQNTCR